MVRPDRPLGAGDLVAQVHAAAERPADLELADRAALEPDQRDRVVLRLDRVHERVGPAHHLDRPVLLAHVRCGRSRCSGSRGRRSPRRPPARRPRTRRCAGPDASRASVPRARRRPAPPARRRRPSASSACRRGPRDSRRRCPRARPCRASASPRPPSGRAASCRGPPCRARAELDRLLVQVVRQPDHDRVGLGMGDRLFEVGRRLRDAVVGAERARPLLGAGVDDVDAVAIALTVQRSRVEETDETRAEHAHLVADHRSTPSAFDERREHRAYAATSRGRQALLDRLESQRGADRAGVAALRRRDRGGGLVHLFGTGHSRIPVEEMFPRYGSYPGFHPIVELSMTFHTQVVGANGQRQAMFIERVEGLAETILSNFELRPARRDDRLQRRRRDGGADRDGARRALAWADGRRGDVRRRRPTPGTGRAPTRSRGRRARPLHAGRRRARRARRRRHAGRAGLDDRRGGARERGQGAYGELLLASGTRCRRC